MGLIYITLIQTTSKPHAKSKEQVKRLPEATWCLERIQSKHTLPTEVLRMEPLFFSAPPSFPCSYRGVEVTAVYFYTVPSPLKRRRLNWLEQCLNNQGAVSLWTNFTRREIQMWRPSLWLSFWFWMQCECERPLPHLVAPFGWSLILSTLEQEWWSQNKHCKSGKDKPASHSFAKNVQSNNSEKSFTSSISAGIASPEMLSVLSANTQITIYSLLRCHVFVIAPNDPA